MWQYKKKLQYPVNIKNPNPKYAQIIISQYGGPDGIKIYLIATNLSSHTRYHNSWIKSSEISKLFKHNMFYYQEHSQ